MPSNSPWRGPLGLQPEPPRQGAGCRRSPRSPGSPVRTAARKAFATTLAAAGAVRRTGARAGPRLRALGRLQAGKTPTRRKPEGGVTHTQRSAGSSVVPHSGPHAGVVGAKVTHPAPVVHRRRTWPHRRGHAGKGARVALRPSSIAFHTHSPSSRFACPQWADSGPSGLARQQVLIVEPYAWPIGRPHRSKTGHEYRERGRVATIQISSSLDMLTVSTWYGTITVADSTEIQIENGPLVGTYYGSFSYNAQDDVFGTLSGFTESYTGLPQISVTGL